MRFLFFNAAGSILFEREDAESASVTHEEMSFQALFPYDAGKEILRGMRIGFEDATGSWQAYEVRKVNTLEPDHYQQITAEHIAVSELNDEICQKKEIDNKTAAQVLNTTDGLLTGTGWAIGTDTTSNTSSGDISTGNVWNAIKTVEKNWNVYILPRITVNSTGITGKYLDISAAEGTWRGFRLSLDKNANEIGVIWDDSKVKTALYGFGQEKNKTALTFKDVVWTTSGGDPADKPANQTYVEDATATAAYGRNGRPRFGYYQNASITDATTLLEKTWEVLQTVNVPDVTVNASITDLHRLGYVDVPLRLHDTALIEVRPTGVVLQKEIIQYTEDLLNPLNSRLTIGTYIPNIIYINRKANKRGGGGGGSGDSQDPLEYTIENNTVQISIDSNGLNSLCVGTGAQLNPDGSLVVDQHGNPVFINTGSNMWSKISQTSSDISLIVSNIGANGTVTAASIVAAVNSAGSSVIINADHIDLNGIVTAQQFETALASIDTLTGDLSVYGSVTVGGNFYVDAITLQGESFTNLIKSASVSGNTLTLTPLWGSAVTFSKATSLSGAWSSGAYTVTATQNQVSVATNVTSLTNTGHWGNSGNGEDENTYYYATYATINGGGTPVATGNTTTISGLGRYNAGVAAGEAKFTLASVTLQGTTDSVYVEASSGGYDYYKAGTQQTLYESGTTAYSTASRYSSNGTLSRKFTGYAYNADGTLASSSYGSWFCDTNLNHTTLYLRHSTSESVLVEDASGTIYTRGTSVTVTPVDTSTKKHLLATTRYKAGTTVSDTYYTKTS